MGIGNRDSQHSFATIPAMHQARSVFDRSYAVKDTMKFDFLTPCFVEEILPGDTINLNVKSFFRLAPQVVPLLDNMYIDWFFFFVPNRLVWNNWQKFMGEQENPGDSTSYLVPQVNLLAVPGDLSLFDHMGLQNVTGTNQANALPLRAYNLIYNEWFRDQNLQNSITVPKTDGPDSNATYILKRRAKKHDYFTSALPWPQKGPAVTIPLGTSAPVYGQQMDTVNQQHLWQAQRVAGGSLSNDAMGIPASSNNMVWNGAVDGNARRIALASKGQYAGVTNATPPYADLTTATAATINQLRQAFMVQSLLELDARGGTRYIEILRAHFGVVSPDARLQRPEYLSGGTTFINQHPVTQTSQTTEDSPQGNLASFATAGERGSAIGFSKSFVEHGFVIGMCQARGDVTYQQGINKMWSRRTKLDYFWPKLQELGEQPIFNKEIYTDGTAADEGIFGYQERYAEYRYHPSEIRGQFRSSFAQTLDVWHLAQNFSTRPALNSDFIESRTPISRNLVVPDPNYPDLLVDYWFDLKHVRPMQVYGVPATLGRF